MEFDRPVPPPLWEMAYWIETTDRWSKEGMTDFIGDDAEENRSSGKVHVSGRPVGKDSTGNISSLGLERPMELVPGNFWIHPQNKRQVIEELGDRQIVVDEIGVKMQVGREASIPTYLEWPVSNREDWERYRVERFDPKTPGRIPENFDKLADRYSERDFVLRLGHYVGFFGPIRFFMGEVKLMTCYYDDPDLIRDIIDDLLEFYMEVYAQVLTKVEVDLFTLWEDMCYNTGPLISPEMFREFMLPAYKTFTAFLRDHGVKNILVDTDGDCWKLIPLFIDGGVTGIYPFEVAANMDVVAVRKEYPKLQMIGGIDKRPLIRSREAIDEELNRRIPYMLEKGGYIPYIDHHVPPDVSWGNYVYYREKLNRMIEDHYAVDAGA
jgi:uroporphyrinogen decarboxylase